MEAHKDTILAWFANSISIGAIATAILGWMPAMAALVGLAYYLIQIYESATVQRWIAKRRLRRLARLKAEALMLETKIAPMPPGMDEPY